MILYERCPTCKSILIDITKYNDRLCFTCGNIWSLKRIHAGWKIKEMKNTHILIKTEKRMPSTIQVDTKFTGWIDETPKIGKPFSIHISDTVVISTPIVTKIVNNPCTNGILFETVRDVYTLKSIN